MISKRDVFLTLRTYKETDNFFSMTLLYEKENIPFHHSLMTSTANEEYS